MDKRKHKKTALGSYVFRNVEKRNPYLGLIFAALA